MVYSIFKTLLLPPANFIILFGLGLVLLWLFPKFAKLFLWVVLFLFYLFSTGSMANRLENYIQIYPPLKITTLTNLNHTAIVILGGGFSYHPYTKKYNLGPNSLSRTKYGGHLAQKLNLPVLVSGGGAYPPVAKVMANYLKNNFKINTIWQEDNSANTYQNAQFSLPILKSKNINKIILVTSAWHMKRAVYIFKKLIKNKNIQIIPAPTDYLGRMVFKNKIQYWLPHMGALKISYVVMYETLGKFFYEAKSAG